MADHIQTNAPVQEPSTASAETSAPEEKRFTQAELDAAIEKRLARERRKNQPDGDGSTEADAADSRLAAANQRHLAAEAKLAAVSQGVPPKRAAYAARLADLSGVPIDSEQGPDIAAVKQAVRAVLADIPELKAAAPDDKAPGLRIGANRTPSPAQQGAPAATHVKPWNKFRT